MLLLAPLLFAVNCNKSDGNGSPAPVPVPVPALLFNTSIKLDNTIASAVGVNYNIRTVVAVRLLFNNAVSSSTVLSP